MYPVTIRDMYDEEFDVLRDILANATEPSADLANPEKFADIGTSYAAFTILRENGRYYAQSEDLLLEIDGEAFMAFLLSFGDEYYSHANLPHVAIGPPGGFTHAMPIIPIVETSYFYRAIDGSKRFVQAPPAPPETEFSLGADDALLLATFWSHHYSVEAAVIITRNDETVFNGFIEQIGDWVPEISGLYELEVFADFTKPGNDFGGQITWRAIIDWQRPAIFTVHGNDTFPGELVVLRAHNVPAGAEVRFISDNIAHVPQFFDDGDGGRIALLPIARGVGIADYSFTLETGDLREQFTVNVRDKEFQIQRMTIDPNVAGETINNADANWEYQVRMVSLRPIFDEVQHWSGSFVWPLAEPRRVTTEFGMARYVNGVRGSFHNALDFGADTGTPVYATNAGRVLFAGSLQMTGNTVVIEHGFGLKSWYYHMHETPPIKAGDMVERGQLIGVVGSTGFSTGPHLHFAMSALSVFINPETIIEGNLFERMITNNV
jgi:hypothetical protein